jgi:hypothetical protein
MSTIDMNDGRKERGDKAERRKIPRAVPKSYSSGRANGRKVQVSEAIISNMTG